MLRRDLSLHVLPTSKGDKSFVPRGRGSDDKLPSAMTTQAGAGACSLVMCNFPLAAADRSRLRQNLYWFGLIVLEGRVRAAMEPLIRID